MVGSISNVIWTLSSDYTICQLNQLYSNSEAAMLSMNGIGKHLSLMIALKKFEKSQEKRRKDNACRARAARKSQHKQISMMKMLMKMMTAMKMLMIMMVMVMMMMVTKYL